MKVCFSGTFNVLHKGHKILIDRAFEEAGIAGTVFIGITEGKLLENKKFEIPVEERIENLRKYLQEKGYEGRSIITIIKDKYGPAVSGDFDAIIVSPETIDNAKEINEERAKRGLKPLKIIKLDYVLAQDGKPISSTRIFEKKIDKEGNLQ
jgi:pantetheine-phosphate adenylyltransferase